jgi:ABC-2 type transport system ATP-binding protein
VLAIEATEVSKVYKGSDFPALKDISLNVELGQIYTLLGRNGAGKTTFVRICTTQLMLTAGTLHVLGYDIVKERVNIRNVISIVPQEARPLRALTPWDHVYNWLRIRGEKRDDAAQRTEKILHRLELYDQKDTPSMNLSGGTKQKILVAMAMATRADLLFLDEPTIGLDPISRRQVWSAIKDWKEEGKSIVLTTHYMDEAETLSDKIVIIDRGQIISEGTVQDLRKVIPHNIRVDIVKDGIDKDQLKPYGPVVDTRSGTVRVFTFESAIKDLSELAIKRKLSFTVSPITLDDIFVSLIGEYRDI